VGYQYGSGDLANRMVEWWKNSDGHRANMLNPQFTEIGVGAARSKSGKYYYCQVFANPKSSVGVKIRPSDKIHLILPK
jgi:uncharacterized protein YkwD